MKKRIHIAVLGALAMTFAGAGLAQSSSDTMGGASNPSSSSSSSGGNISSSAQQQAPDLSNSFKSSDLLNMNVTNRQNETLGSISELIVDKDGKVSNVVLSEQGTTARAGNKYLVPWNRVQLNPGQDVAIVDVPKNTLTSEFAAFDSSMTAQVKSPSGASSNMPSGGASGGSSSMPSGGGSSGGSSGY